jgi:multidrug efflux pump subunit AcrA (membrane-fusion protein)
VIKEEKAREASQRAEDQRTLAEARAQGKEAHAAAKARIAQEREAALQAKKIERLRVTAERQAEKARVAAENKARQLERKVRDRCPWSQFHQVTYNSKAAKRKATSQTVEGLPEGGQRVPPPPVNHATVDAAVNIEEPDTAHDKFSLHPDDPGNFLRLSAALRLLVRRRLTDTHIDRAEQLIREYCTELLLVSLLART